MFVVAGMIPFSSDSCSDSTNPLVCNGRGSCMGPVCIAFRVIISVRIIVFAQRHLIGAVILAIHPFAMALQRPLVPFATLEGRVARQTHALA